MQKFTDIHHHILYGLDDGAQNPKEMRAMLRKAANDGIGKIVATPHVTPGVRRFDRAQYRRALEEANAFCAEEGIELKIYEGAEILYTYHTADFLKEGRVPTMAGSDHVLVEFSPDVRFDVLSDALDALLHNGYCPIVAHVERYQCLGNHFSRAEKIKDEMNVAFQVNCSSILGNHVSGAAHRFARKLLEMDLVDAIGTDAHSSTVRSVHMTEAWKFLKREYGRDYANELTDGHLFFDVR